MSRTMLAVFDVLFGNMTSNMMLEVYTTHSSHRVDGIAGPSGFSRSSYRRSRDLPSSLCAQVPVFTVRTDRIGIEGDKNALRK